MGAPAIAGADSMQSSSSSMVGLVLIVVDTMSAGFAAVRNELIFKRNVRGSTPMPFMMQNAVLYMWGLAINLIAWHFWGEHGFLEVCSRLVWLAMVSSAIFGLMCSMMLRFLDNAVRCFSGVAQILFTVIVSRLLPAQLHEGSFDIFYLTALVLLTVAMVLYQAW